MSNMDIYLTWILARQAVRRRFDKRIYIPLPDLKARQHMFKVECSTGTVFLFITYWEVLRNMGDMAKLALLCQLKILDL
jgi:SpoVK/Ycf46/Vps4 family AAA+-type ATPase